MSASDGEKKKRACEILGILAEEYPEARTLLNYTNPFELLAATILAAQCTDERVNEVTPKLFGRFPDPESLAKADRAELETIIRSTGFFKNKAKSLLGASRALVEKFGGAVPGGIDELTQLPGVGRKTANVVAGNCFGVPAIIVDTHLKRVTLRLGLAGSEDPDKIELEIRALLKEEDWTRFSRVINFHGRSVCQARKPKCPKCAISRLCPYPLTRRPSPRGRSSRGRSASAAARTPNE
jgi:endonuclease-3